ncbi:hypothetical protein [Halobacillus sp. BAB-2008]|nr:hypothetical protein [Halobacillus sp. BAB-2008]
MSRSERKIDISATPWGMNGNFTIISMMYRSFIKVWLSWTFIK